MEISSSDLSALLYFRWADRERNVFRAVIERSRMRSQVFAFLPARCCDGSLHRPYQEVLMLSWAMGFLILAIIAGVLGFGGIAGASAGIAKILFIVFLVIFVISLIMGRGRGKVV